MIFLKGSMFFKNDYLSPLKWALMEQIRLEWDSSDTWREKKIFHSLKVT